MNDDLGGCLASLFGLLIVLAVVAGLGAGFLLFTGRAALFEQINIQAGNTFEVPNYGPVGNQSTTFMACHYFTGRGTTWRVFEQRLNAPPHQGIYMAARESCPIMLSPAQ